jgi:hypothetical protein
LVYCVKKNLATLQTLRLNAEAIEKMNAKNCPTKNLKNAKPSFWFKCHITKMQNTTVSKAA